MFILIKHTHTLTNTAVTDGAVQPHGSDGRSTELMAFTQWGLPLTY